MGAFLMFTAHRVRRSKRRNIGGSPPRAQQSCRQDRAWVCQNLAVVLTRLNRQCEIRQCYLQARPQVLPARIPAVDLEYSVTLDDHSLTTALKTFNSKDSATAIKFKMFYHNYLNVSHVQNARVWGLSEGARTRTR